jgi:ADP-ribosyl-[dinitrogen reductase] hydrolase
METQDRFVGALLGHAVGNAFGGPLAFMSREQIQIKHGVVTEMIGGGWLGLRPGETTEETEMMLLLAESLVEKKGFDRGDVSRRYVEWLGTLSNPEGVDNITRAALSLIAEGTPVEEASRAALDLTGEDGATNGTVARCVPIGLLRFRDEGTLLRESLAEAAITHHDRRAASGAAIVNLFLARIVRGVPGLDALFGDAFTALLDSDADVIPVLDDVREKPESELRSTGRVADTLEVAFHAFYHAESFEDCIVRTVNRGGHTDTTGAVAGALAGAFHGPGGIPDRWLRRLQGRLRVEQAARRLYRAASASGETG